MLQDPQLRLGSATDGADSSTASRLTCRYARSECRADNSWSSGPAPHEEWPGRPRGRAAAAPRPRTDRVASAGMLLTDIDATAVAPPRLPKQLEGLRRLAYNLYWTWHPEVRDPLPPRRRGGLGALPQPDPGPAGHARLVATPRRHRLHGRVRDAARPLRRLHRERRRPLVRAPARRRAERADRLLLRRVRSPRVARHLLRRPGRAGRRSLQDRLRHGAAVRRRRPHLPPRLLPPDHRRRRPPGARLPRLRPCSPAAPARHRRRRRADPRYRSSCPAGRSSAAVWLAQVGRVPLLLLDTDVPENERSGPADHPPSSTCAAARCASTRRWCSAWAACGPCARWASSPPPGTSTRVTPRSCSSSGPAS